jgi:tetratricopeptide (TPR) repeat protein
MREISPIITLFKPLAAASLVIFLQFSDNSHAYAQTSTLDGLFSELQVENPEGHDRVVEKIWREWRRSGSDAVDFLLERGMDAMSNGNLEEAIDHFSAAIDHAPEFAEAWNMRATAFFMMEEYGLSVADIQETLRLNPRHFGALGGLGTILERTERPKQAQEVYKKLLEVHPHSENAQQAVERLTEQLKGTSL